MLYYDFIGMDGISHGLRPSTTGATDDEGETDGAGHEGEERECGDGEDDDSGVDGAVMGLELAQENEVGTQKDTVMLFFSRYVLYLNVGTGRGSMARSY